MSFSCQNIIQHWMFLVGCWAYPNRSLVKSTQTIQKHTWHLANAFIAEPERLVEVLNTIRRCLAVGCRINKCRAIPHTY